MKKLKFTQSLTADVLSGRKTSTWRLFDDKDLSVHDELIFIEKESNREFAYAVIISVREKMFEEIDDLDFNGHKEYATTEEMYEDFQKHYGSRVTPKSVLKIIDFKLRI